MHPTFIISLKMVLFFNLFKKYVFDFREREGGERWKHAGIGVAGVPGLKAKESGY